jgi:hypothetical protein
MSARGWAAFAAMSAIWGVPYLFLKIALDDGLSPAFVLAPLKPLVADRP